MNPTGLESAVAALNALLAERDSARRMELIRDFADGVRSGKLLAGNDEMDELIGQAFHEFHYYEPREDLQVDRSLYGDEDLDRRIESLLELLGDYRAGG